jgi:hypothetical protein
LQDSYRRVSDNVEHEDGVRMASAGKIISGSGIVLALIIALCSFMCNPTLVSAVEPVITPGPLGAPFRVASYTDQFLLVSDYNSGTIFSVSKSDPSQVETKFQIEGNIMAVAYFEGHILVGNSTDGSLEAYNSDGGLEYTLNGKDTTVFPSDLAVDQQQRQIFLVDSNGHEIKVYQKKGLFSVIGTPPVVTVSQKIRFHGNFGADVLVSPVGIAIDPSSKLVYVSDHGSSMTDVPPMIYVFTYAGVKIDQLDSETYSFYRPRGLAFDSGKLYVMDTLASEVTVIDVEAKTKLGVLGEYGSGPGQLLQPQDVVVEPGGEAVYVANKRLGRIELFTGVVLP